METVATRGQLLWLKCTKFDFGWGSAPDPAGGAHSAPQTPYLDLRGLPLRERRGGKGKGREGGGKDRRGGKKSPPFKMSACGPVIVGVLYIMTSLEMFDMCIKTITYLLAYLLTYLLTYLLIPQPQVMFRQ